MSITTRTESAPTWSHRRRRTLVASLLVALPILILAGAWPLGGVSALEDDLIYYLPVREYIGQQMRAGHLPLWNPLSMMGTSVAADPQSGLWYPATYLFALLPPLVAYAVTIVLHFALAGGGMYRWRRASGDDWRAALLAGMAFEFSGYLVAHRAHLTIHHAAAWLPWIFLGWRRFADTGRYRHFALASAALGLQMLVQHVQVTIITAALLTGYVAVVLLPGRRRLWWQYPAGLTLGATASAVQVLPTWLHFADSGRAAAAYSVFIENSWAPTSALMLLFPMVYGSRTPNLWDQPWWGISHFCEQSAYGSILILLLAGASWGLIRRREAAFWWAACAVALMIALGESSFITRWLFHVPVYRNLRVPARWILVWSVALPVLASMVASAVLRGGDEADRVTRWIRRLAVGVLPALTAAALLLMIGARLRLDRLAEVFAGRYQAEQRLAGLNSAIRPMNPAIWWPIVLITLTAWLAVRWSHRRRPADFRLLAMVMVVDLAGVAMFVDVDTGTYRSADVSGAPLLAEAIHRLDPHPGDRLLVPRYQADYHRPLEVLWPNTNVQHGLATFNGYGPFWPTAHRWLFRFDPWGSGEAMLELLRRPGLLRAMGVRFVAVRSDDERQLQAAAMAPADVEPQIAVIPGTQQETPVRFGGDILWPIRIGPAGIYELAFDALPVPGSPSRVFVRLENAAREEIGWTRRLEPIDLAMGPRRFRFLLCLDRPEETAFVRIKSEMGQALSVARGTFGRIADLPSSGPLGPPGPASPQGTTAGPPSAAASRPVPASTPAGFVHRADLPGGVSLYELPGPAALARWAERVEPVADLRSAVDRLTADSPGLGLPATAVVEWPPDAGPVPPPGRGTIEFRRLSGHELLARVKAAEGGILVFNESFDPGWRVTVDGAPGRLHRVNAVCMGTAVPPGAHEVRFRYRPRGLAEGAAASSLAWLLIIVGGLAGLRPVTPPVRCP